METRSLADRATTSGRTIAPPLRLDSIAAVYGGGGVFGIGYGLGVASALIDAGAPLRTAPSVGTSAGSWVAGALACQVNFDELASLHSPRVPNLRPGLLLGIGREAFGDRYAPLIRAGAVRIRIPSHLLLDGACMSVAHLVAASSAVPGLFAPVRIHRDWYVDGGVRSLAAADRAPHADHLLVVAPIAGPLFGLAGRVLESFLGVELGSWRRRHPGGTVHLIRPNGTISALIRQPLDLFDQARASDAYWLGREQVADLLRARFGLQALVLQQPEHQGAS